MNKELDKGTAEGGGVVEIDCTPLKMGRWEMTSLLAGSSRDGRQSLQLFVSKNDLRGIADIFQMANSQSA